MDFVESHEQDFIICYYLIRMANFLISFNFCLHLITTVKIVCSGSNCMLKTTGFKGTG